MGAYVNPKDMTKEDWLKANAEGISPTAPVAIDAMSPNHLPVCLVDNGPFTAAGIAFNERELQAFNDPNDYRMKVWFWVPKEKLMNPDVSDLHYYLKDEK